MVYAIHHEAAGATADEKQRLEILRRSRSAEKRETLHAAILLDLAGGRSASAAARSNGVNRHTVALCAGKYFQFGLEAVLGDLPRQQLSRSRLHKILTQGEIRPHKILYDAERRDPQFAPKMVAVVHVYKEVEIVNQKLRAL